MKKYILLCSLVLSLSFSTVAAAGSSFSVSAGSLIADVDLLSISEGTSLGLDPFLLTSYEYQGEDFSCSLSAQLQFAHAYALKPSYTSRFAFDPLIVTASYDRWGVISLTDLGFSPFTSEFRWQLGTGYIGLRPLVYADTSDVILDLGIGWGLRAMESSVVKEDPRLPECIEGYDLFLGMNPDMNLTYDLNYTSMLLGLRASAGYGRRLSEDLWIHSRADADLPIFRDLLGEPELSPDLILSADIGVYQLIGPDLYLQGVGDLVVHNIFDALVMQYTAAAQLHLLAGKGDLFVSAGISGLLDGIGSLDVMLGGTWEVL